jgi:adenylate cyclase
MPDTGGTTRSAAPLLRTTLGLQRTAAVIEAEAQAGRRQGILRERDEPLDAESCRAVLPLVGTPLVIELINWVLKEGTKGDDLAAVLEGLSERLVAQGISLCRTTMSMPTIDPTTAVLNFEWSRDHGLSSTAVTREDAYDVPYQCSPLRYLLEGNITSERWKLEDPEVGRRFPLFDELRSQGITEYALRFVPFSKRRTALQGVVLSMATDRRGGFTEAEIDAVGCLLPALSIVAYRFGLSRVATEILSTYLGPVTGSRVLQGMIVRGDSEVISAALLLADLRGSTALFDGAPGTRAVGWLNEHLQCIGEAVQEHGGEILKFLGDGLLAVFASEHIGAERACDEAVRAAIDACERNAALGAQRARDGGPALDLSIALHFGDIVYGNIGTARRLDFTVVGPAVNEVSRMEALAKSLGRELVLSESIARLCLPCAQPWPARTPWH